MVRIIVDGPRNAVVLFTAPATLVIANLLGSPSRVTIQRLWYDMGGIADGAISWVATANVLAWRCTGVYHHDFEDFAGITNNAGVGVNGNIIVTAGVGTFSLAMKLKKH